MSKSKNTIQAKDSAEVKETVEEKNQVEVKDKFEKSVTVNAEVLNNMDHKSVEEEEENPILKIKNTMKNPQMICGKKIPGGETVKLTMEDFNKNEVFKKKVQHGIKIGVLQKV